MKNKRGQVLLAGVVLLLGLSLLIPVLIQFVQNESRMTLKVQKNTQAFHLAELALERGYQQLILTTSTWVTVSSGGVAAGFNFDTTYTDPSGGEYQIRLSSSTGSGIFITAVARDKDRKEVRAVRGMFTGSGNLSNVIYSGDQISVSGSSNIEWGPVMARNDISGALSHPRYYSTGKVDPFDTAPGLPNTDNVQWWSYYANVPQMPNIDLNYYKNQAIAAGATTAGCGGTFYKVGNIDFQGCIGPGPSFKTGTWYMTGNGTFKSAAPGNGIQGTVIMLGNLEMQGNGGRTMSMNVPLPPQAWKEYANDWAYYLATWDPTAPATYAAAVAANYLASGNRNITNILIDGLMYTGGNYQATGAGNAAYRGAVICVAQPSLGSNITIYFNPALSYQSTTNVVQRTAWQEARCTWDVGNAVCQ